ncbi:MAG: Crp/Fnr family transcriptional regulator [Oscillospiraceae bacterium]|nr:Crp/Fnr family transcriptional regulator [Oscillospiraceae bacterium]
MDFSQKLVANSSFFRGVDQRILEQELLTKGRIKKYSKGTYLLLPQQVQEYFAIILKGKIHTQHLFADGNCSILDVLEEWDLFGVDLVCTKSRISPYHAVAATDLELLTFPWYLPFTPGHLSEAFRQELQLRLLRLIANSNIQKEYRLAILSQKGLRERVLTYLQMQAAKRQVRSFEIPFSRDDLASFLCVNRSALSHELSKMQEEGLIRFRKNSFTLLCE